MNRTSISIGIGGGVVVVALVAGVYLGTRPEAPKQRLPQNEIRNSVVSQGETPIPLVAESSTRAHQTPPVPVPAMGVSETDIAPKPNDPDLADPSSDLFQRYLIYDDAYFSTVDATRLDVDRPRQPGEPPAPPLIAVSARHGYGRPGEEFSTPIEVRSVPGAPVTFTAPDWGEFQNGQRCITVKTDGKGIARVKFRFGEMASAYTIVAHSPESSGTVVFKLEAMTEEEIAEMAAITGGK